MHAVSTEKKQKIREGIEAAKRLAQVVAGARPEDDGDEESEEFLHLASEIQEAALRIEVLLEWEAE